MTIKIFGIRSRATGSFQRFNNKTCWASTGAAKLSYTADKTNWCRDTLRYVKPHWDEQDDLEILELTEFVHMYEGLCK